MALAAGYSQTCAVLSGGGVECWGRNEFGQLGTGDTMDRLTPTGVPKVGSGTERYTKHELQFFGKILELV